jgi:hypothetical protein
MEPVEVDAESGAARTGRDEEIADGGKDGDETLQGSRLRVPRDGGHDH